MTPEERAHELGLLRESDGLLTQREVFLLEEINRLTACAAEIIKDARREEAEWWRKHGIWPHTAEFDKFREHIAALQPAEEEKRQ